MTEQKLYRNAGKKSRERQKNFFFFIWRNSEKIFENMETNFAETFKKFPSNFTKILEKMS